LKLPGTIENQTPEAMKKTPACPLCFAAQTGPHAVLKQQRYLLNQCGACGHRYLVLLESALKDLESIYVEGYAGFREDPHFREVMQREVSDRFVPRIPPPARILDVGCGNGVFLQIAQSAGYEVEGIDISEAAATICRKKGISARAGDFLTLDWDEPFDLITMWDVIEHLPNPRVFFQHTRKLLKPDGYFVFKTPWNTGRTVALTRLFPRLAGALLHVPHHIQFYSEAGLRKALGAEGFGKVDLMMRQGFRQPPRHGTLMKRIRRAVSASLHLVGGDGNFYAFAQNPG